MCARFLVPTRSRLHGVSTPPGAYVSHLLVIARLHSAGVHTPPDAQKPPDVHAPPFSWFAQTSWHLHAPGLLHASQCLHASGLLLSARLLVLEPRRFAVVPTPRGVYTPPAS